MSRQIHTCFLAFVLGVIFCSLTASACAQKVGSPEWKREFERKMAESKRKHEAMRAKIRSGTSTTSARTKSSSSRNASSRYTSSKSSSSRGTLSGNTSSGNKSRNRNSTKVTFNAANAPAPVTCLKQFRKASKSATSPESLLPYLSKMQRSNQEISAKRGSKHDSVKFHRDLLNSIVRYDDVRIKGNVAHISVVRYTGGYNTGTFTMKGEGNRWKMDSYKDRLMYNYMPPEPKK